MKDKFGIEKSCCGDCCTVCFCPCCALVQEAKEADMQAANGRIGYLMNERMVYERG